MRQISILFCLILLLMGLSVKSQSLEKGEEFLEKGEVKRAEQIFRSLQGPDAREFLGDIESFRKNWGAAVKYYKNLVEEFPESARYNFKLGGALGMKAMEISKFEAVFLIDDIKFHLNRAAKLAPGNPEVRRALVELYTELPGILGGSRSAAKGFAVELEEINSVDAALAWAYIFERDGEEKKARGMYIKAIEEAQAQDAVLRNYLNYELGKAAAVQEVNSEEGLVFLQKYVKNYGYKDLKSPEWAYLRMAQIKANQQKEKEALEILERILNQHPEFDLAKKEMTKLREL